MTLNNYRCFTILLTASTDIILMSYLGYYIAKYIKKIGNERDLLFLTSVFFIFLQQLIRVIASIIVASLYLKNIIKKGKKDEYLVIYWSYIPIFTIFMRQIALIINLARWERIALIPIADLLLKNQPNL